MSVLEKQFNACIYARLSRDDGDKLESDSITNQRALIRDFISKHPEIIVVSEKTDDGYSGVNFDRPAFQEMMDDIRSGKINCVVVKDLSRFGRNYIEAGNYIERVFPFMGVRFIAINDNYDSIEHNQSDSLIIPFKNLINDACCKDISVKIRSQLEIKRKNGEFIGAFAVYGYLKEPEDHNRLIIDTFASEVVRSIFKWKRQGMSQGSIANKLNAQGVLCPMEYKLSLGMKVQTNFRSGKKALWSARSVTRILTNEIYTGVLIQGKCSTPNYKVKKIVEKAQSEWVRIEDAVLSFVSMMKECSEQLERRLAGEKKDAAAMAASVSDRIQKVVSDLKSNEESKFRNMDALMSDQISKDEYQKRREILNAEEMELRQKMEQLQTEHCEAKISSDPEAEQFIAVMQKISCVDDITNDALKDLIKEVRVFSPEQIEIVWRLPDEFLKLMKE